MVDPGTYWCVNYPIPNILVDVGGCLPIYVLHICTNIFR